MLKQVQATPYSRVRYVPNADPTIPSRPVLDQYLCAVINHNWSLGGADTIDFQAQLAGRRMQAISGLYVDNSQNTSSITIGLSDPINTIHVAGGAQGVYPVYAHQLQTVTVSNDAGQATGFSELIWTDTDQPLNVWASSFNTPVTKVSDTTLENTAITPAGGNSAIRVIIDANGADTTENNPQFVQNVSPVGVPHDWTEGTGQINATTNITLPAPAAGLRRLWFLMQNQSANTISVIYTTKLATGAASTSTILIGPGAGAGLQGGIEERHNGNFVPQGQIVVSNAANTSASQVAIMELIG